MSWLQKLYETYQQCEGKFSGEETPLMPIGHTAQQAQIEITLNAQGKFLQARVLPKGAEATTLVPATEDSANRTSGLVPHPLADKIQYCAGDYPSFGAGKHDFASYQVQLRDWCQSEFAHPKAKAVLAYIDQKQVVQDLVREKVCWLDEHDKLCTTAPVGHPEAAIFKVLTAKDGERDQGDAFVRWRVSIPGDTCPDTWSDTSLAQAWIDYYRSQQSKTGFCMVSGTQGSLAEKHPSKLRNRADKAKLISSNDTSGFTYRGRFQDADQAAGVSFEVTQKAHNALRWLIARQGFKNEDQVILAWAVPGQPIPDLYGSFSDDEPTATITTNSDAGQTYALRLNKAMAGYRQTIDDTTDIIVMALDSATQGRMALTFYRELTGSEFLDRVQTWREQAVWYQHHGKGLFLIGPPPPKTIAEAAYGLTVDTKLKKATIERLLPCIIDGSAIPRDLVDSAVRRASNPVAMKWWDWENTLGVACALFRAQQYTFRRYEMKLEEEYNSRDYLYGRLLAIADHLEAKALQLADETRDTNAQRLMHRFAASPFTTWPMIHDALAPYKARLRAKAPGILIKLEQELDRVNGLFKSPQAFSSKDRLSGEYLLGFYCQRQALWAKKDSHNSAHNEEAHDTDDHE